MSNDALPRPPPTAAATSLAPGFRFHPTDDELVSYYLKRRVIGRPLRADAISEVDLYKVEPWDLPSMSRIQSRDMEWYFFSPLDKKYATRSRTSRTTGKGYWKTTGKDRAVKHGSHVAGMKKTLVFHIGKAPNGDRTNWVMHEYRLSDEDLAKAGIPQDSYVVCRIFQKNGSGPQNGAQYGAPFVEEEWEEDGKWLVPNGEATEALVFEYGDQPCMQIENSDQEIQGVHIQEENDTPLSGSENVCNFILDDNVQSHICQPAHENEQFINGSDFFSGTQNNQYLYNKNVVENNISLGTLPSQVPGDDYLELNDFAYPLDAEYLSCQDLVVCDDTYMGRDSSLLQLEWFDSKDGGTCAKKNSRALLGLSDGDNFLRVELNEFFNPTTSDYFPDNFDAVMEYFDAPSQIPAVEQGAIFTGMNEPDVPDLVDELLAFFDATEDDLTSSYLENPVTVEGNQDNTSGFQTFGLVSDLNGAEGPLSSSKNTLADKLLGISPSESPLAPNLSSTKSDDSSTSDVHSGNSWHKSLTNHFVNMLESISSPPAFAEPPPSRYAKSLDLNQAQTSTSIRFTAGVVQLNNFSDSLNRKPFSNQKEDPSVLLSYSLSRDDVLDCPGAFDSVSKLNCELGCCLIRSGFCVSFVSVLFLAASFGVYICTR